MTQYNLHQTQTLDDDATVGQWNAPGTGVGVSRVTTVPHSGVGCLQVTTDAATTFGSFRAWASSPGWDVSAAATTGKQVTVWLRSASGTLHVDCLVGWVNASNAAISTTNYSPSTVIGTTWTKVDSGSLTPPALTAKANTTFSIAETGATLYVDDFVFQDYATANTTGYPTAQTSGLESTGVGEWATSYTTTPLLTLAKSTTFAHTGTGSLLTTPNAAFLSAYARSAYPGYTITNNPKTLSIWARPASGSTVLSLRVTWYDATQTVINTTTYATGTFSSGTWSKLDGGTNITPPTGAAYGNVVIYIESNVAVYWDDLVFADTSNTGGTGVTPTTSAKVWVGNNGSFVGVGRTPAKVSARKAGVWAPANA
jgi:hypothetical protein